jgi:hypothetical protein
MPSNCKAFNALCPIYALHPIDQPKANCKKSMATRLDHRGCAALNN